MSQNRLPYRADIDGLRSIAVMAVVLFHSFPKWFRGGFVGVDVFFVISGYLITRLILKELKESQFRLSEFYSRRVQRIFPALCLVMIVSLLMGGFRMWSDEFHELGLEITAGAGFFSNFLFWSQSGYFDADSTRKPLLHLWSLAVEEQFYLIWPLLILWFHRLRLKLLTLFTLTALISLAWCIHIGTSDSAQAFYSPISRIWEFLAGAILAYSPQNKTSKRETLSALGILMVIASVLMLSPHTIWPGLWTLVPVVGSMILIGFGTGSMVNQRILSHPILVKVGLFSYPLYLWHWIILYFVRLEFGESVSTPSLLAVMAISSLLAALTLRWIEMPIRTGMRKKSTTYLLLVLVMGSGAMGWMIHQNNGFPERKIKRSKSSFDWPESSNQDQACVSMLGKEFQYCRIAGSFDPTVALVGDSFANAYFEGFSEKFANHGEKLIMLGSAGCPPLVGVFSHRPGEDDACKKGGAKSIEWVLKQSNIHTVLLAANWNLYVTGSRFHQPNLNWMLENADPTAPSTNGSVFRSQLSLTLRKLKQAGKKIIFIKQTPENHLDLRHCLRIRDDLSESNNEPCLMDAKEQKAYLSKYESVVDPIINSHPYVKVIDPYPVFCDLLKCRWIQNDRLLYRDHLHLTTEGSRYFANGIDLP